MYKALQYSRAKQVNALLHIHGVIHSLGRQSRSSVVLYVLWFFGNVFKLRPRSAPVVAVSRYHLFKTKKVF